MPHDWNDLSARQHGKTWWWTEVGKEEDWMNKVRWEATRVRASRVRQDGNNLVVGGLTLVRDGELGTQKQHTRQKWKGSMLNEDANEWYKN